MSGEPGDWYLITPAQPQPQRVGRLDWYGPSPSLLDGWIAATPEAVQDVQLLQLWASVCHWCESVGVDDVVVEGAVSFAAVPLKPLGFVRRTTFSLRRFPFPFSDLWEFSGLPSTVASVLRELGEGPGYTLTARSRHVERIRLMNDSWDAVYVNVEGLPDSQGLSRLRQIVEMARSLKDPHSSAG